MDIIIRYILHSDPPPPDPSLDLHQHELVIEDIRSFMFNIHAKEAEPPPPPPTETYIVITTWVRVRDRPSTATGIEIGRVYKDNTIEAEAVIIEGANTWAKTTFQNQTGYIAIYHNNIEYMRKLAPLQPLPPLSRGRAD